VVIQQEFELYEWNIELYVGEPPFNVP